MDVPVVGEGFGEGVGLHGLDACVAHCGSFGVVYGEIDDGVDPLRFGFGGICGG